MRLGTKTLIVVLISAVTVAVTGPAALAVHADAVFELDGNAVNSALPGDDWDNVFGLGVPETGSDVAHTFVADADSPTDTTYFKGGLSKDPNDVSQWQHSGTDVAPDKDEILNAYAAAYASSSGLRVYFGADRFARNGDAAFGFWFFQNPISLNSDGTFSGVHSVNDVLVVSQFTNGGSVSTIQVYKWNGSGLTLLVSGQECSGVSLDVVCARVNTGNESAPWPYTPKSGSAGTFPAGSFFEGGVSLSDASLFGSAPPCFSSFLAETRASQEANATLRDFAIGSFDTCATVKGMKYHDLNANSAKNTGEGGLPGWEIHLFGTDDRGNAVHRHQTTASNGTYEFRAVRPGTYTVCETQQSGWSQSAPAGGASCSSHSAGTGYSVTVGLGDMVSNRDFGNFKNATKSGAKFEDSNGNGVRNAGEPGLSDWEIHLFGTDGLGNTVHEHDTTDANGEYSVSVSPGSYTVCETQKTGWSQSRPGTGSGTTNCAAHTHGGTTPGARGYAITLASDETDSGNDFGNFRQASKTGMKFEDQNANGVRDAGEPGLAGWQIHLFGTDALGNAVHVHAITDADGDYSFGVSPGSYTVCESLQGGWTQSMPGTSGGGIVSCTGHSGAHGLGYGITLTSEELDSGNDFGNYRDATKSGSKFEDLNANGVRDNGEPGLANWDIHLTGTDGKGNAIHQHALTDADGAYTFTVPPGSYSVCEEQKSGWAQSMPGTGAGTTSCSGHTHGDGSVTPAARGYAVTFQSGDVDSGNDFGNFRTGTVSGAKFEDRDADVARDSGEPGLSGWEIHLFGTDGMGNAVDLHDTTDSTGAYSFTVAPGSYTVCETQQIGWTQSVPATGADCSAHGGGIGYTVTVASGQMRADNDFGNFRAGAVAGMKFEDVDGDADEDAGEPSLSGWEIHLFGTDGRGNAVHLHDTTDSDGDYSFSVAPGSYTVCETQQSGWTQSVPASGADCSAHGGGVGYEVTVTSNETVDGNDFGNFRAGSVSGAKIEDADADGVRDAGEVGLAAWEIHLFGTDGRGNAVHEHALTGLDGGYSFTVAPGSYTLCETTQPAWTQSMPSSGVECAEHGGGLGYAITVTSNSSEEDLDFGNYRAASQTGVKFEDLDGDGVRDDGEPGVAGIEIHLFGTGAQGEVHQHAITDDNGDYGFTVLPGTYTVCETAPDGWTQSHPSQGADCSDHGGGVGYLIVLASGRLDAGNDFGNFRDAIVAGAKFDDLDRSGARDDAEPGLADWEIHVVGTDGMGNDVHEHVRTAADGTYSVSLPPGSYTACETTREADLWVQSFPGEGADCSEHGGGVGYALVLTSAESATGIDFGNFLLQPGIDLVKTASPDSGTPGTVITYTYVVTNTGEVDLVDVVVDDDQLGRIGEPIAELAVGESVELTATTVLGDEGILNVAVAEGTDAIDRTVTDEDSQFVTVVLGTVLEKTGSDPIAFSQAGLAFLGIGIALVAFSRRRRFALERLDGDE